MAGYTRQSTFADGDTITAALFNNEFNQLLNAFSNTSGHKHDGTANEGPVIGLIGDAGETSPNNKVLIDTTNNYIEFYVEVSSAPVQQLYIADGAIIPVTDSDIDLGTTSLRFKDTYTDTVTTTGNVSIGGDLTVTGSATISGNLTFGDADTDSINLAAEIDSDIIPNTDGTYDLGSATKEWQDLYIDGTANIDSLIADTADINGGTIDGATIATSDITVGAGKTLDVSSGTLTLADDQISGDKVEGGTIAATTITTLTSTTSNITNVNATTVDSTNIEVTNLKAKDGTSAGSIADSTGVVTLASSVLTTTDINGGTIDGSTIATSDITVGTGKTLDVSAGTLTLADNQISGDKVEGGTIAATTITDLTFGSLNDGTITVTAFADEDDMSSDSATLVPTQQSVKAYVDSQVTAQDLDFQGDSGGALSIDLDSESLTIAGGTGIDTSGATNTLTVAIDSTVATLTGSQTLTNKTLTTPIISSISNTGTLTLPTSTDTLVGRATTDTLTNKTLTSATLTSPVINTGVSGTAFLDDDTFATASATTLASSESIKAYVDTTVAATNEVVEDTTPQLGGDLDLNSSDITGTGNINITGTIQSSGNITGTLATAAQPNITSVGTLTGFTSTGIDDNATSTAITIDSSENVGIGTSSPSATLELNSATQNAAKLRIGRSTAHSNYLQLDTSGGESQLTAIGASSVYGSMLFSRNNGTTTSESMRIDSSGNVGIGTSNPNTPAGNKSLHIAGTTGAELILERDDSGVAADDFIGGLAFLNSDGSNTPPHYLGITARATNEFGASQLEFFSSFEQYPSGTPDMTLDASGRVGIGTSSPNFKLENTTTADIGNNTEYTTTRYAFGRAATPCYITAFRESFSSTSSIVFHSNSNEGTSPTEKMRITSSGNVGIGTDSPSRKVHIDGGSTDAAIQFTNTNTGSTGSDGTYIGHAGTGTDFQLFNYETGYMRFGTTGLERMRIDGSGRLLVGKTSTSFNTAGVEAAEDINGDNWALWAISDHSDTLNGTVALNRNSYDGDILRFHKDSSSVGSIGTSSGYTKITSGDGTNGSGLQFGDSKIYPVEANSVVTDNSVDFGDPSYRFKDLYLSGGAYLGGTGSANYLDDYEEGTWTPSSGTTGITIQGTPSGTYTKIGRIVYYTLALKCNRTGSGSTQVVIAGLPFSGTGGILQFTRFEPTGISYQWINGTTSGTGIYLTRPGGTAPGTSGGTNNNDGPVLQIDDISSTTNSALQNVNAYGWYSV